jgi:hypothetical protein
MITLGLGLFFLAVGGSTGVILSEKWNWLSRKDRNRYVFITLAGIVLGLACLCRVFTELW